MKLIGITGQARSGKDTVAHYLWVEHGYTRIAFADPLKLAAQHIFGLTDDQTWKGHLKEVVIPYWDLSPRQMFQLLGTEAVKGTFGDDTWCKRWKICYDVLSGTDDIVVPDVRTDVEAAMLRSLGGVIIELTRNDSGLSGSTGAHSSENGLSTFPDYEVTNNGSIQDLHDSVDALLRKMA